MGDLSRWHPRDGLAQQPVQRNYIEIDACATPQAVEWRLPPSKSHLIRWLLLAAQAAPSRRTRLIGGEGAGTDAEAMKRCLRQLGVTIDGEFVEGVGVDGFRRPASVLHCDNSGTSLNLLTAAVARMDVPVMLDGDATLRRRGSPAYWAQLVQCGVEISHGFAEETLPLLLKGPISGGELTLDAGRTSQHLSGLMLASCGFQSPLTVHLDGELVSQRHAALSVDLARQCGADIEISPKMELGPWAVEPPTEVQIPRDASHIAFARLFEALHGTEVEYQAPEPKDALGAEILLDLAFEDEAIDVDLRDANDLITPLAAILCLTCGGRIHGAAHAAHKESNRLLRTADLLAAFGLKVELTDDGLRCEGGQVCKAPERWVETYGDHRQYMTAVVLASKVGATVEGDNLHEVSHPAFLEVMGAAGVVSRAGRSARPSNPT